MASTSRSNRHSAVAKDCTDDVKISSAQQTFDCDPSNVKVTVDPSLQGNVQIDGPKEIKDLIVSNATKIITLSSSTLEKIGGQFIVEDGTLLGNINMQKLASISTLRLLRLPQLNQLTFSSDGISDAESITISGTFLSDLGSLKMDTVQDLTINGNKKLTTFSSSLVNITKTLIITSNGNDMQVNLTQLESAAELQISNVASIDTPALKQVSNAMRFEANPNLETYEAANLTTVGTSKNGGSVSFINNAKLANMSFPVLKTISGDLTVVNNTKLDEITGFPELTTVYNMLLGGSFVKYVLITLKPVCFQSTNANRDTALLFPSSRTSRVLSTSSRPPT